MIRQESGETNMHGPGELFAADTAIETLVHVTNIGTTDTAFTVAVYTRDQFNGKKALEALKAAIADILDHWNTDKYRQPPGWATGITGRNGRLRASPAHTGDSRTTCAYRCR